jgi:dTDP-4-dehydrorhamnose 3,5-epimerase
MQIHNTTLPEVKQIIAEVHDDERGFFSERFHAPKLAALGFVEPFVQINHSHSVPKVLRGIHFQHAPMQGKLVGVTSGAILDVAVDLRPNSPRFGKHVAVVLTGSNGEMLWIPPGFGHGFCVLGDAPAEVVYGVTAAYQPGGEGGVRFDDPALAIEWPVSAPIVSARDRDLPSLAQARADLETWFAARP